MSLLAGRGILFSAVPEALLSSGGLAAFAALGIGASSGPVDFPGTSAYKAGRDAYPKHTGV